MKTDPRIEEIDDIKHHKYMIMIAVFGISTILYCVPFSLSLIDMATANKFGKYTILIISSIYLLMNIVNVIIYIRLIRGYNKTLRDIEIREIHETRARGVPMRSDHMRSDHMRSDHIIINMPGRITGQSK
jgi:hypothetical protein